MNNNGNKTPLISIIIPIYNVEKYLRQCIESIIGQTYKNIEIILIDDGSPDNCGKICDEYSRNDSRVKVIHKKNGGLSDARNKGIDLAKGEYITFVDSDDFVENVYIEYLYNAIRENKVRISQCSINKVKNNKVIEKIGYSENDIKTGRKLILDLYEKHPIDNIVVWNKMYDIKLFQNIRFPVGKIHEDEFTTYKIFYSVDKIAIINKYLYNYRQTEESIMGKKFNIKNLDSIEALEKRLEFFKRKNDNELYEKTLKKYLEKLIESYMFLRLYTEESESKQKEILKKYRNKCFSLLKLKEISIKYKIKKIFFNFFPMIYFKLKKNRY